MKRAEVLKEAERCVCTNRESEYGSPEASFHAIAELWNAFVGDRMFDSKDVACMMSLLKIARIKTGFGKADNWVDLAGYAACGCEIESEAIEAKKETASFTPASPTCEFCESDIRLKLCRVLHCGIVVQDSVEMCSECRSKTRLGGLEVILL